ncbi:MAG: hypothetical protein V4787_09850 [Pseudomonadota bacterium]
MNRIFLVVGGCAVVLVLMTVAEDTAQPQAAVQPTREAKVDFMRKCIRNMTPAACNAPAEARLLSQ